MNSVCLHLLFQNFISDCQFKKNYYCSKFIHLFFMRLANNHFTLVYHKTNSFLGFLLASARSISSLVKCEGFLVLGDAKAFPPSLSFMLGHRGANKGTLVLRNFLYLIQLLDCMYPVIFKMVLIVMCTQINLIMDI